MLLQLLVLRRGKKKLVSIWYFTGKQLGDSIVANLLKIAFERFVFLLERKGILTQLLDLLLRKPNKTFFFSESCVTK